jgi:hypothetical protein
MIPRTIPGTNFKFMSKVSGVMVFQMKIWKGSLKIFTIKNSQAAVPINSFFGSLMAKK